MEIKPTYVTWEQAKLFKEKGSNIKVKTFFDLLSNTQINDAPLGNYNLTKQSVSIPEQWQVVEWLRINYGIWISIQIGHDENKVWYNVYLEKIELTYEFEPINNDFDIGGDTPQEAYSAAFDYILNKNLI